MSYEFRKPPKKDGVPSGWRGIGCILILLLPVLSYGIALFLLENVPAVGRFFSDATPWLWGTVPIPPLLLKLTSLNGLWSWLSHQNNLMLELFLAVIILIFLSGFISMIYAFMYRAVAPSKYGPTDAPPPKRRGKRKKYNR